MYAALPSSALSSPRWCGCCCRRGQAACQLTRPQLPAHPQPQGCARRARRRAAPDRSLRRLKCDRHLSKPRLRRGSTGRLKQVRPLRDNWPETPRETPRRSDRNRPSHIPPRRKASQTHPAHHSSTGTTQPRTVSNTHPGARCMSTSMTVASTLFPFSSCAKSVRGRQPKAISSNTHGTHPREARSRPAASVTMPSLLRSSLSKRFSAMAAAAWEVSGEPATGARVATPQQEPAPTQPGGAPPAPAAANASRVAPR